jgi:hypothetical protein
MTIIVGIAQSRMTGISSPPFHAKNNETTCRIVPFPDREKVAMAGAPANMGKLGIRPGANRMAEYRAYAIGSDGHIVKAAALVCDDDDQAIARAKLEFENYTIEVWSGVRFVVRLDCLA